MPATMVVSKFVLDVTG